MMHIVRKFLFVLLLVSPLVTASNAFAGPYTDDLTKCMVESTTREDRSSFVRWMFTAASLHPAVASIASVSDEQRDTANRQLSELFLALLTERCRQQTKNAVRYEGETAVGASFEVLGKVAANELFSNPEVAAGLAGLEQYFDAEKFNAALAEE